MALSDTKLRAIHGKPYSGKYELTDVDGLSVRVSPNGVVTFQCRYRLAGKQNRVSLGRYPSLSLRDARVKAGEIKILVESGIDPRDEQAKAGKKEIVTVCDCVQYWEDTYVAVSLRKNTQLLYQAMVIKHLKDSFHGRDIRSVTAKEWVDLFSVYEQENPRKARQLLVQLKSAVNWCIRRQFIDYCNLMKISPQDVGEKSSIGNRVLTYKELAKIWIAIERSRASTSNKSLHQMTMLWGSRLSELRLSTTDEFDTESFIWTVPVEHSKTKKIIRRPIFPAIKQLLDKSLMTYNGVLFPGDDMREPISIAAANRYIRRIRDGLGIGVWRAHDFRRTLATRLSEEGVALHVIEKMLGHELGGIMAVYNKHDWIDEQKEAYELHASKLLWHIKNSSD